MDRDSAGQAERGEQSCEDATVSVADKKAQGAAKKNEERAAEDAG